MPSRSRLAVIPSAESSAALKAKTATACLVAKDAVDNLAEFISENSRMAYLAVKECERELDHFEREIDERLPSAITRVGERKARELVACLRFTTDLERIGDLVWWIAQRWNDRRFDVLETDTKALQEMAAKIVAMLQQVHDGFLSGNVENANNIISRDREIDELRRQVFQHHLAAKRSNDNLSSIEILFMTQALERAGDHATNLAEELIHLYEGRSVRHLPKKISEM
jgi:phosphate transport system protein